MVHKYTSLMCDCPRTLDHVIVHLKSADNSVLEKDLEQVRHDLSIAILILESLGEENERRSAE